MKLKRVKSMSSWLAFQSRVYTSNGAGSQQLLLLLLLLLLVVVVV
jgi:hypothetical protein